MVAATGPYAAPHAAETAAHPGRRIAGELRVFQWTYWISVALALPSTAALAWMGWIIEARWGGVVPEDVPPEMLPLLFGALAALAVLLPASLIGLVALTFAKLLLYRAWAALPRAQARTGPLAAVLLLLVPLYQFYWAFVALRGLFIDLNRHLVSARIDHPVLPVPLATWTCIASIAWLAGLVPHWAPGAVGAVAALALTVLIPLAVARFSRAAIAIVSAPTTP